MTDRHDRERILASAMAGALAGGMAAFLLTSRGRHLLANLNPALDDLSALLQELRRALRTGQGVAGEARAAAEDLRTMFTGGELPPVV